MSLQNQIKQDLEKQGTLSEIRKLFKEKITSLIKDIQTAKSIPKKTRPELESKPAQICLALAWNFFESFGLKMTASLFEAESHLEGAKENIELLENALGQKTATRRPLLFEIIERTFAEDEDEEDDDYLEEDIDMQESQESQREIYKESGNSQGYDQSVNSLAMNEFDYVENVRKVKVSNRL